MPIVNDKNSCTSGTKAHEDVHIADAKAKWGSNLCRSKPAGYIPTAPGNHPPEYDSTYKRGTECRAYKVQVVCLKKLREGCKGAR